ncbi:hypothetical protein PWT90_06518 [Aphanocladium album]|nr:hypothetical protein PWT90_06518 [Aphanocladium album]
MDALRGEETAILRQIQSITSSDRSPEEISAELRRLQSARGAIRDRMRTLSDADSGAAGIAERHNVFEDITLEDNSYNFAVSTVGDLVTARRINLTGRSYNVTGQLTDESFQRAVEVFANSGVQPARDSNSEQFHKRHGRGTPLTRGTSGAASTGRS